MAGKTLTANRQIFGKLAKLLTYPSDSLWSACDQIQTDTAADGDLARQLSDFRRISEGLSFSQLQEVFTRTFDLAPVCSPYLTTHIWGDENFERGTLMSKLQERYLELGMDSQGELPDHLAMVLEFLSKGDAEETHDLANLCLREPLEKMCQLLDDVENPYSYLLQAIKSAVAKLANGGIERC